MFVLAVEGDVGRGLTIALGNWRDQKELADARLLAEAAARAHDPFAAAPVIAWVRATGVHDARLERSLELLR
jgi:hypothetical protein